MIFVIIWGTSHGKIHLCSVLLPLPLTFVCCFRLELMHITHWKYQVKPHSSPWFSSVCAAAIVHRNYFFRLHQKYKSSGHKVMLRQASNRYKRVFEAARLAYANKTKESITFQKLVSWDFWWIDNTVLNKAKSAIPPLFNCPEKLSSAADKAKLLAENFSKNSNLDDSEISLHIFLSRTNLKLHNISVTAKMVKKVIINLDFSKVSGPDCIPVVLIKNCEPERSYILAELFSKCFVLQIVGRFYWWSLCLRLLGKGLQLRTKALLVFFLWFLWFQIGFSMLVFFINLSFMEFKVRCLTLFLLLSAIDGFKWCRLESIPKNI